MKPERVEKLKKAVPDLLDDDVKTMQRVPFRSYDPSIANEPLVYRMQEVRFVPPLTANISAFAWCLLLPLRNVFPKSLCKQLKKARGVQAVMHNGEAIHAICAEV